LTCQVNCRMLGLTGGNRPVARFRLRFPTRVAFADLSLYLQCLRRPVRGVMS
jgi:hypothetical protein